MTIYSYPTVYAIGHKQIQNIFDGPVTVEEKVDGSQFSFGLIDGELQCRSKGAQIILDNPEKMFQKAVDFVLSAKDILRSGWIYRCEYLQSPKHNALAYDRVPQNHLIGFDVCTSLETYMTYEQKKAEFARLDLETVPILFSGKVDNFEQMANLLELVSILGGQKIEGFVVKNYNLFTEEKKVAIGKFVSEKFKEVHKGEWRAANPMQSDITSMLIKQYRTPARWQKAVQHLRESGLLDGSPKDIGPLMKEVSQDVLKECEDEIKDALFAHFWKQVSRGIVTGFPEWYKETLAKSAFLEYNVNNQTARKNEWKG